MDPEEEVTIERVSTEEDKLEYCLIEREYLQIPKEEELKVTGNVKKQSEINTLLPDTKKEESINEKESIIYEQWNEIEKMKNKLKETEKRIDDLEIAMEKCLELTEKIKNFILSDEMNKEKPIKEKLTGVFAVKGDENKNEPTEQLSEEKETGTRKMHESTKKENDLINCNQSKENVFVGTNQDKEEDVFFSRKVGLIFIYFVVFCLYLLYALFQS
ncbi:hypothetical protein TUBRATIS_003360 [Tubulinosema ratisbonensis]|uniref:Uncharacterized protein n=1 Tax=Tubulinosema ratisbonensis TaxID=291195 RepID=A0A437AQ87_9MICR|nr:hypothetical protein TUBRATIS_003360 [Tubulinosema ratisbonensis]